TEENWNRPQTVTVRAAHDPDGDYDEAWVSHRVTGPAGFAGLAVPRMRIGVRDDETSYGELRAEFTGVSQRDPAPATHRGETFRIALHWSLPRTPHHWENPWPALGPGGAVRVTGATVRPVHTPGFGRFTGHALVLEFTPDGPGTDVTLTLLQMDCARVAGTDGPNPKALCGVLRDGGTRYTGLAGRQRWTVRGLEGLAAVTSVGLVSDPGPDRRYTAGDTIRAEVAMSRAVHRDGAAPTLALDIGEVRREMALADWPDAQSGTARDTLAFAYRVVAEDRDLDGLAIPAGGLALNGGTLTDPDDLLRAPYVRLERERRFPSHLVQGVIPRVVKVQRHRNRVWVHFDRDFAPLLDGNGMTEDQFRVRYSVSKNWLHDVTDARVVRGRGWAHQCGRGAAGCRVVRLTLGEVRRHKAPETGDERTLQIHGAPLADETVEIFYAPNPYPHFEKYRLRDAHDNPVVPFGPVEAVLLAAGDNPVLSVSDARGWESIAHLMTLHFHVRLVPAATSEVTVNYETREGVVVGQRVELRDSGTATHDVDYEGIRPPRTLVFAPGETQKTVTVKIIDDGVQDPGEVFALVLTEPSGAAPGDMVGQGTIHNDEELTAAFAGMPESHDGATPFMFGLEFNTPVTADAATVRGALRVTGAAVTGVTAAPAEGEPAGKRFRVSVTPSGGAAVRLRIVATPECAASGAVCTADGVGLDAATAPPVPYGGAVALRVSGVAQAGRALAAALAPVGVEAAWQWLRGAEEIAGATGATYTPAAADVGARLSVRATLA
ncbi:MAG: hypothetical protein OXI50_07610, partial [Gammaproteobacteria bacterium]|nr:hypothetical protein [Gammaproteobacteria bacterium]